MNHLLTIKFIYYNVFILYNTNYMFTIKFTVTQFEPEKSASCFSILIDFLKGLTCMYSDHGMATSYKQKKITEYMFFGRIYAFIPVL